MQPRSPTRDFTFLSAFKGISFAPSAERPDPWRDPGPKQGALHGRRREAGPLDFRTFLTSGERETEEAGWFDK